MIKHGAGETAQLLRALALAEVPDMLPTSSSVTLQPPATSALGI